MVGFRVLLEEGSSYANSSKSLVVTGFMSPLGMPMFISSIELILIIS